jgi:enoyl-CoA hydratase/carnithine racemase
MADVTDDLLHHIEGGIVTITFNRPNQRNALTFAMYERLAAICQSANEDPNVRAILLTGTGEKAFASGTDISQFRAFKTPQDAIDYEERIDRVIGALETCRVPTIAAIAGACTGGGAGIAAACDLRIATADARFGFPVARTLGNCLSMSNYTRLVSLIGPARTKDLIYTARLVGAAEAHSIGLLTEVVADFAALMPRAQELVRTVAANAPLTLRATKMALQRLRPEIGRDDGQDLILMCYGSADFREGMDAFLTKRQPVWTGT